MTSCACHLCNKLLQVHGTSRGVPLIALYGGTSDTVHTTFEVVYLSSLSESNLKGVVMSFAGPWLESLTILLITVRASIRFDFPATLAPKIAAVRTKGRDALLGPIWVPSRCVAHDLSWDQDKACKSEQRPNARYSCWHVSIGALIVSLPLFGRLNAQSGGLRLLESRAASLYITRDGT